MNKWICLHCLEVFYRETAVCSECLDDGDVVAFSPIEHADRLVGSSNAWVSIAKKWDTDPLYQKVWQESTEGGSYGAATILTRFINEALYNMREAESDRDKFKAMLKHLANSVDTDLPQARVMFGESFCASLKKVKAEE